MFSIPPSMFPSFAALLHLCSGIVALTCLQVAVPLSVGASPQELISDNAGLVVANLM